MGLLLSAKCKEGGYGSPQSSKFGQIAWLEMVSQTSISANADGVRNAASRKTDHITLPIEFNYQAVRIG